MDEGIMWHQEKTDNESDVEQKIIYPLLTEAYPTGLGVESIYIKTKANIRRLQVGKGQESKIYFPDYALVFDGYPVAVIEAKAPNIKLDEAYREARLYANEINGSVQSGINTCKYIFAVNNEEIWFGYNDQSNPVGKVKISLCDSVSNEINELQVFFDVEKVREELNLTLKENEKIKSIRPKALLGGKGVQGEELDRNTFGATVTSAISKIFNPISKVDREYIAKEAYVNSRRKQRYVEPIDKLIRAANSFAISDACQIEDTKNPKEIISKLRDKSSIDRQVMLLIGSVGSGKSTFIDHLFYSALDSALLETVTPIRIDMNTSPLSANEIYSWLRNKIISGCRESLPDLDFDTREVIEKLYSSEINKLKKGELSYFEENSPEWNKGLYHETKRLKADEELTTQAYIRFCCAERGKTLIVALDNCDKKEVGDQLLMFQVAQWLQASFRCLVILPLRDETYDNYRSQPPLDTALKDLVFRIEPPLLQQVLVNRVKLSLKELKNEGSETLEYSLPNGYRVEYPKSERAYYLTSILSSIFEHDNFVRNIIVGLSGRNIRRALEIFIELCNSAHFDESDILKIRQSEGKHKMQFHKIVTILLRMNKRYYSSEHAYIKNIFDRNDSDNPMSSFSRYLILSWLNDNKNKSFGSVKGYHPILNLADDLNQLGISKNKVLSDVLYLIKGNCIVTEDFKLDDIDQNTLIKIAPSGDVHLQLSSNITYLSAISEECLFEYETSEKIKKRITYPESQMDYKNCLLTAIDLYNTLDSVKSNYTPTYEKQILGSHGFGINLENIWQRLESAKNRASEDPWFEAEKRYSKGTVHEAIVHNKMGYGCFVNFDGGLSSRIKNEDILLEDYGVGDKVKIQILWVNSVERKIGAKVLSLIEEESDEFVGLN
ncbi:RNA-binding protein [Vibrio crassostreae]|uniref:type I restriction enzyme HsdR N-terminal domain-containing protein n=1 Tax=Vibrio crassostreae TaxID=246167 RepID=UPI00148C14E2|nr:type I restriction enzyme HsdR N-terminal domain-containing protein [Vibrio crassostreae]NOH76884.1 RNA-binding protein [Vibrio crassostreae]